MPQPLATAEAFREGSADAPSPSVLYGPSEPFELAEAAGLEHSRFADAPADDSSSIVWTNQVYSSTRRSPAQPPGGGASGTLADAYSAALRASRRPIASGGIASPEVQVPVVSSGQGDTGATTITEVSAEEARTDKFASPVLRLSEGVKPVTAAHAYVHPAALGHAHAVYSPVQVERWGTSAKAAPEEVVEDPVPDAHTYMVPPQPAPLAPRSEDSDDPLTAHLEAEEILGPDVDELPRSALNFYQSQSQQSVTFNYHSSGSGRSGRSGDASGGEQAHAAHARAGPVEMASCGEEEASCFLGMPPPP